MLVQKKRLRNLIGSFALAGAMTVGLLNMPVATTKVLAAGGTASELVALAASQVGYHEKASNACLDDFTANSGSNNYNKYARDLGVTNGYAWCATFIWWCMRTASVPENSYPSRSTVTRDWFNQRGLYRERGSYTPKPGDYVVFGNVAHCGIVESVSGGYVTTIEGNSSDQVRRNTYSLSNSYILGYGIINYNGGSSSSQASSVSNQSDNPGSPYPIPSGNLKNGSRGDSVKWVQKFANDVMGAGITVDGSYGNQTEYAVRVFQQNNGLTADGICGAQTTNAMLSKWRSKLNEQNQAQHNPKGVLDVANSTKDGKLYIRGWMFDPDATTKSNVIHVYIGGPAGTAGAECYAVTANTSRSDVDNVYHVGEFHGYEKVLETKKTGKQAVYVYGINEGVGTTNPEIGHATVNLVKEIVPATEQATEAPKTEEPVTEQVTETPQTEEPSTEQTTEVPRTEEPTTEQVTEQITTPVEETVPTEIPTNEEALLEGDDAADIIFEDYDDCFEMDSPEITKLANAEKKTLKIKIDAVDEADGYDYTVVMVTNKTLKKFKKAVWNADEEGVTFKGAKTHTSKSVTVKFSGLKKNKKYAVVVRAYRIVDGVKYYSDYSSVRTIKIKK